MECIFRRLIETWPRCVIRLAVVALIVLAAMPVCSALAEEKVIIAYVFPQDRALLPDEVNARKLTRINYAFANIKDGEIVEGFSHDEENFATLGSLKSVNPSLKVLVSVGGWTWSGGFSDVALTHQSRTRFIASAVRFVERHHLDGLDIDWEYPGQVGREGRG